MHFAGFFSRSARESRREAPRARIAGLTGNSIKNKSTYLHSRKDLHAARHSWRAVFVVKFMKN